MIKNLKTPNALKPGDTIRIVASSSPFDKASFLAGVKILESWGYNIKYSKGIFTKSPYLAGTDKRRSLELIKAINDPKAKAILFARGGYGAMRLLPYLDAAKLNAKPKIVLGYSDITALLVYLQNRLGWVNYYGPVVAKDISLKSHKDSMNSLKGILDGSLNPCSYKVPHSKILRKGKSTGIIVGGCLTLLVSLLGTKHQLNTKNRLLFIEDTNEKPYQIDRMLTQLKLAGTFNHCKGLIVGSMNGPNPADHYIEAIKSVVSDYKFPVMFNFPAGHDHIKLTLPLGIKAQLDTSKKSLTYLEPTFK